MKGNEEDCICAKPKGKHEPYCDAFRLSTFLKKCASATKIEIIEIGDKDAENHR